MSDCLHCGVEITDPLRLNPPIHFLCTGIYIRELQTKVDTLEAAQRWIPTSVRLPTDHQRVLIPALFGRVSLLSYSYGKWYTEGGDERLNLMGEPSAPTLWMPLPTPPTTKDNDNG